MKLLMRYSKLNFHTIMETLDLIIRFTWKAKVIIAAIAYQRKQEMRSIMIVINKAKRPIQKWLDF